MNFKLFVSILVLALAVTLSLPAAAQYLAITKVHFDQTVAVPGQLLPPGDYVFRAVDSPDFTGLVQIQHADGTPVGVFHTTPVMRTTVAGSNVQLSVPVVNGIRLVKDWYVTGSSTGFELDYAKKTLANIDTLAARLPQNKNAVGD